MSDSIHQVIFNNQQIAIIVRSGVQVTDNLQFFTPSENPLQVALHNRAKETTIKAHLDECSPRTIEVIQEVLYLISGEVEVDFFTSMGDFIESQVLKKGDTLIQLTGGHGFRMLKSSRFLEIKQGPYEGINRNFIHK